MSLNARHLATVLGQNPIVCAEALRQTGNNLSQALKLLLSPAWVASTAATAGGAASSIWRHAPSAHPAHAMRIHAASSSSSDYALHSPDSLMGLQDVLDENASYALLDSSAAHPVQRFPRPSSPHKKPTDAGADAAILHPTHVGWAECNFALEERVRGMNWHETEQEEEMLSQSLTAAHARKVLQQLVRLFTTVRVFCVLPLCLIEFFSDCLLLCDG